MIYRYYIFFSVQEKRCKTKTQTDRSDRNCKQWCVRQGLQFKPKLFDVKVNQTALLSLTVRCESPEPVSAADLQALTLTSLSSLTESSCGFTPEVASYQVLERSVDLGQAFMTSQMSDISIPETDGMQEAQGHEAANSLIEE